MRSLLGEDDDFFARKHNPRMPRIVLTKNQTIEEKVDHPRLKMLVSFQIAPTTMVVDLWIVVVTGLQEVVVVVVL